MDGSDALGIFAVWIPPIHGGMTGYSCDYGTKLTVLAAPCVAAFGSTTNGW